MDNSYVVKKTNPAYERALEEQRYLAQLAAEKAKEDKIKRLEVSAIAEPTKPRKPYITDAEFLRRKRARRQANKSRAKNRRG